MFVTVFTPTYNRARTLTRLYTSLCGQEFKDFEWIIVDDGSSDDTKSLVQRFCEEKRITISYLYQANKGKPSATAKALSIARGQLFFIVDSDDYLPSNSLQAINVQIKELSNSKYLGLSFGMLNVTGEHIGNWDFEDEYVDCEYIDWKFRLNHYGDRAEVFFTDRLRSFTWTTFSDEKWYPLSAVWNELEPQLMRFVKNAIYIADYQQDGMSMNRHRLRKANPKGCAYYYLNLLRKKLGFKVAFKCYINLWRFSTLKVGFKGMKSSEILNLLLLAPIGFILLFLDYINITSRRF